MPDTSDAFTANTAIAIAVAAHAGQWDKGRPTLPYITHPMRVMAAFDDPILQMIGVLHDVVEDSKVTIDDLVAAGAPERVVAAVELLTHRRHQTRVEYLVRLRTNPDALAVKLEDNADNADPARLALLDPDQAARLEAKYASDRKILLGS